MTKEITSKKDDPREDAFVLALSTHRSIAAAARAAGYPQKQAANGWIYQLLRSRRMQDKIRDYYDGQSLSLLPAIHSIESTVIRDMAAEQDIERKGEKLRQHAAILKQIKQQTGVIGQDAGPGHQTIHIHQLQAVINQAVPDTTEE